MNYEQDEDAYNQRMGGGPSTEAMDPQSKRVREFVKKVEDSI